MSSSTGWPAFKRFWFHNLALLLLASCSLSGAQEVGYQSRIEVAKQMLLSGQYTRGYQLLDDVQADHQNQLGAHLALGEAYLEANAFLKAQLAFERAKRMGRVVQGNVGLGRVSLARNDPAQASKSFSAALERDRQNLAAFNGLGVAQDLMGNHSAARDHYRQALRLDPTYEDSINNIGLSLALSGSGERAVQILSDLARSKRDDATVRQNLAISYHVTGRADEALRLATADTSAAQAKALFDAVIRYRRRGS